MQTWRLTSWGRKKKNGRHFADDIFKWILLDENLRIQISLEFIIDGLINEKTALVQIIVQCPEGDKPSIT